MPLVVCEFPRVPLCPLCFKNSPYTNADPEGRHRDAAYFSTDEAMPPARTLGYVVQRWSLEVTFDDHPALLAKVSGTGFYDQLVVKFGRLAS